MMSPHQTIAVAVRLFAIWLTVHAAGEILSFYSVGSTHYDSYVLILALSAAGIVAITILALWFFPLTIAHKLLALEAAESAAPASPDLWLGMGCALIGLWMLATSLPALVRDWLVLYFSGALLENTTTLNLSLFYYSAKIVIALWLILGARGFRQVFWWAQNAGHSRGS